MNISCSFEMGQNI